MSKTGHRILHLLAVVAIVFGGFALHNPVAKVEAGPFCECDEDEECGDPLDWECKWDVGCTTDYMGYCKLRGR